MSVYYCESCLTNENTYIDGNSLPVTIAGQPNVGFNIGSGFNNTVRSAVPQSDGKLLVGGDFTSYSGVSRNNIIRLNTDGSIDTSFIIGTGFTPIVTTIQLQSDGKILVGGSFTSYSGVPRNRIIRLNTDGSIDTSFVIGTGFNTGLVSDIQLQSDGKILVGGTFTSYSGVSRNYIVRLNTDGSVDTSFVIGTGFTISSSVNTIQLQPDGKILAGGSFTSYSGVNRNRIIRLNTDGSVDTSFVIGTGFTISSSVSTISLQPDGKILAGGSFTSYSGVSSSRFIRLNTDGSVDTSFVIGTGFNGTVNTIELQSDGKILVGGSFINYSGVSSARIIRLNTDGSIDPTFFVGSGLNSTVLTIIPQFNGSVLIGGMFVQFNNFYSPRLCLLNIVQNASTIYSTDFKCYIPQYEINGQLDTTFKYGGFSPNISGTSYLISAEQIDGKILVGGAFTSYSGVSYNRIIRLNTDGSIDNSFIIGTGFNNTIRTIVIRPDGKILVGGLFTSYSGVTRNRIIRLNTDGSIDTSFVIGTGFNAGQVNDIQLQPDGKILVGGSFSSYSGVSYNGIIRLNDNGSIDASFVIGTGFGGTVNTIELQSDGKILVGGTFTTYGTSFAIRSIRLNENGTIDTSFTIGSGFNGTVNTIKVNSDNKILFGGNFTLFGGNNIGDLNLGFRPQSVDSYSYNTSIKTSNDGLYVGTNSSLRKIDNNGNTLINVLTNSSVNSLEELSDTNLLVGGSFTTYSGISNNRLVKVDQFGNKINSFNIGSGFSDFVYTTKELSDGRIFVGGSFGTYSGVTSSRIIVLNSDGSINKNFSGTTGIGGVAGPNPLAPFKIDIQSDNKIIIAGSGINTYSGINVNRIFRLNTDYTLDYSFDTTRRFNDPIRDFEILPDGKIIVVGDFTSLDYISFGFNSNVFSIQVQSDGKILVGGDFTSYNGISYNRIINLNSGGTINTSFSVGTGFNGNTQSIQIQSDGKILVGGIFNEYSGTSVGYSLIRLNTDGSIDTSFDVGVGFDGDLKTIELQSDGKIIAGGYFSSYSGISVGYSLIRLESNGSIDTSFDVGIGFSWLGDLGTIFSTQIQSDGKILVSGEFDDYNGNLCNGLIRLETDGTIDSSFYVDGTNGLILTTKIQSDGKILVGGQFTSYSGVSRNNIIRLNTDGSIDTSFVIGTGFNSSVYTIQLQTDGKILVGGLFGTYSGVSRNNIIRLNTDGSIDTSFVIGTGFNSLVDTIQLQPDGKILAGGQFNSYSGVTYNRIVRLNSNGSIDGTFLAVSTPVNRIAKLNTDGTLDSEFVTSSGFNNKVYTLERQSDGKIFVGGDFSTYSGISSNRIARLNSGGTYDSSFVVGTGFDGQILTLTQVSNEYLLAGGVYNQYNSIFISSICEIHLTSNPFTSFNRFAILNPDGSADTTANIGTGFSDSVSTIEVQSDNKILLGGLFTTYSGLSSNRIIRLNPDYTNDETFGIGTGFNVDVNNISLLSDDKILVVGQFTTFNEIPVPTIARLYDEVPVGQYQAMFLFDDCEVCDGYVIPISANTEYEMCEVCSGDTFTVEAPHPVWTGMNGGAVTQLDAIVLGGPNGLNN